MDYYSIFCGIPWFTHVYPISGYRCDEFHMSGSPSEFSADPQQAGHLMRLCLEANDARGFPLCFGGQEYGSTWVNNIQVCYSERMGRFSLAERMVWVSHPNPFIEYIDEFSFDKNQEFTASSVSRW